MKSNVWIELREFPNIDYEKLSTSLYKGSQKSWSSYWLRVPNEIISWLEEIVNNYMRIMWLDSKLYPARVDVGLSKNLEPIIYEITTWFVDQIGSCLQLMDACDVEWGSWYLAQWPMNCSVLTLDDYKNEYDLMLNYLNKSWVDNVKINVDDAISDTDKCFVYGYPSYSMKNENYIPWKKWLLAEKKDTQIKVLQQLVEYTPFIVPRTFSILDTAYSELPSDNFSWTIFKQILPKWKGERNTIKFWKSGYSEKMYASWKMLAQEFIPNYRDERWKRVEWKFLFVPTAQWTKNLWFYSLSDTDASVWSVNSIINDWYPQWPWLTI